MSLFDLGEMAVDTSDGDNDDGPPTFSSLPAEALALVLDHLNFADVRSMMLTCKFIPHRVAPLVSTLNIMKPKEMNLRGVLFRRRLTNISTININCLFHNDLRRVHVLEETVARTVPFLSAFPKLGKVRVAGACHYTLQDGVQRIFVDYYDPDDYVPAQLTADLERQNASLMKAITLSFCGAFQAGTLRSDLDLVGLVAFRDKECRGYYM